MKDGDDNVAPAAGSDAAASNLLHVVTLAGG